MCFLDKWMTYDEIWHYPKYGITSQEIDRSPIAIVDPSHRLFSTRHQAKACPRGRSGS